MGVAGWAVWGRGCACVLHREDELGVAGSTAMATTKHVNAPMHAWQEMHTHGEPVYRVQPHGRPSPNMHPHNRCVWRPPGSRCQAQWEQSYVNCVHTSTCSAALRERKPWGKTDEEIVMRGARYTRRTCQCLTCTPDPTNCIMLIWHTINTTVTGRM